MYGSYRSGKFRLYCQETVRSEWLHTPLTFRHLAKICLSTPVPRQIAKVTVSLTGKPGAVQTGVLVGAGVGSVNLLGHLVAVLMMLGNALYMVLIGAFSKTPVVLARAASAFQLFVIG